jgi:hypothetical protein
MPLEWTHEKCRKPECNGTTDCPGFPTIQDRINMAQAAYEEYAESDGTSVIDFALDVLLFTQSQSPRDATLLPRLATQARRELARTTQRNERRSHT